MWVATGVCDDGNGRDDIRADRDGEGDVVSGPHAWHVLGKGADIVPIVRI